MLDVPPLKTTPLESLNRKIRIKFRYLNSTTDEPQQYIQIREDRDYCILYTT